jgi:hypothetical protein
VIDGAELTRPAPQTQPLPMYLVFCYILVGLG